MAKGGELGMFGGEGGWSGWREAEKEGL